MTPERLDSLPYSLVHGDSTCVYHSSLADGIG